MMKILVFLRHVVQIQFVVYKAHVLFVHAQQIILDDHQVVDQNVSLTQIAQCRWLVLMRNVRILVKDRVDQMLSVELFHIHQCVTVITAILEIHSQTVINKLNVREKFNKLN